MSSFFRFRRQRKIHHALIFARKAEKQYSYFSFEERMAVFSACSKAYNPNSNYACDERVKGAFEDYLVNSTVWSLFNSNSHAEQCALGRQQPGQKATSGLGRRRDDLEEKNVPR